MNRNALSRPIVRVGSRALGAALLAGLALAPTQAPGIALAAPQQPLCRSVISPTLSIDDLVQVWEPNGGAGGPGSTGVATFNVTLSGFSTAGLVTVHFATGSSGDQSHAPATAGSDFVATSGDLTFRCGDPLTQQIQVTIIDDGLDGGDQAHFIERYSVRLSQLVNATFGNGVAIGEIVDTDALPPPPPPGCTIGQIC
jgi:hypothetical protein